MPIATQKTWLKTMGRLPWWWQPVRVAKANGNGQPHTYGPHAFATTQLDLPPDLQAVMRAWVTANVAQEDLSPLEKQDDVFHVTVLYGLRTDDPRAVEAALRGLGAVHLTLGGVRMFDANPDYDVLVLPVQAIGLQALRDRLTARLPWTSMQAAYVPHVTLAYLVKGAGRRLLGRTDLAGRTAVVDRLRYTTSAGVVTWVSLLPTRPPIIESGRERLALDSGDVHIPAGLTAKKKRPALVVRPVLTVGSASYAVKANGLTRQPTPYEKKVDFAAIVRELDTLGKQGRERVRAVLIAARDKLLALVERKMRDGALTTKFVNDLELRGLGQLAPTLREVLRGAFQIGQKHAGEELYRGRLGLTRTHAQGASNGGNQPGAQDQLGGKGVKLDDPASVLEMVQRIVAAYPTWTRDQIRIAIQRKLRRARAPLLRGGGGGGGYVEGGDGHVYQVKLDVGGLPPEKALEFFDQKSSLLATDIRDPLLGDVKGALYNAIKTGQPLRDTLAVLTDLFLAYVGDEDQTVDDQAVTPYRLETLVRTNTTEAMNEGRKAAFQDSVDDGFVIGLQYTAIIDTRTTQVCQFLDGLIFPPDSPEVDELSPPRHYNCRSLLSPVLRTEGPVEYITPQEVAKGLALSGEGFADRQKVKVGGVAKAVKVQLA